MRLCTHVRQLVGSAKPFRERGYMEHISRLKGMPNRYSEIAYTNKRKHNCSVLPMLILQIFKLGQYRNAFLASFSAKLVPKIGCKNTNKIPFHRNYFPFSSQKQKKVTISDHFYIKTSSPKSI